MDKNRKTSHILNVFQYDADGHVVLPASLTLSIAPGASDNNSKVPTTAWVRTYVSGLSYQGAITLTTSGTSGAATLVGNTLNIPTYTLAGLGGQPALSGTGFVKISGTTISYDNNTYATETYVGTQIANLVASAPATLDTLNELATALGNDPNFATTVATNIGTKQAQLNGTGFVKVTGTTVSYDNSTYLTTSSAASTYQTILTNPITGTGTTQTLAKFTSTGSTIGNSNIVLSSGANYVEMTVGSTSGSVNNYNTLSLLAVTEPRIYLTASDGFNSVLFNSYGNIGFQAQFSNPSVNNFIFYYNGYSSTNKSLVFQTSGLDRLTLNQNGSVRLNNYTTNGFVKFSGSDGTLIVDTNTYLTSYTETDTLQSVILRNGNTNTGFRIENGNSTYSTPASTNVPVIYMLNTSSNANAHAVLSLRTLGPTGGDPFISLDINGVLGYHIGIDNSDGDKFKIGKSWAEVGSNTYFTLDTSGNATFSNNVNILDGSLVIKTTAFGGQLALEAATTTNQWLIYHYNPDNTLRFNYNGAGGDEFIMATGGATTFSSSVTANSFNSVVAQFNPYTSPGTIGSPVFQDSILLGPSANAAKIQFGNEFSSTHGSYIRFLVNSPSSQNTSVTALTIYPSAASVFSNTLQVNDALTAVGGRINAYTGGINTYGIFSGYGNSNHLITLRAMIGGTETSPTFTAGHQTCFVEYAEPNDTTGWFFKSSQTGTFAEVARITRSGISWNGNTVWHAANDGSGSGLDADLLDGRDSGGYMTQIQGGIEFLQGSYSGWYKLARSSQASGGAGLRGSFKIIVAATGNYLTPSQDEITGFKDWTTTACITSIASSPNSIFQNFRITYDADYSYLEGYVSYYFGGNQSIVINSYVNGLNGLTWTPYTGTIQASSTSNGAVSIGKSNNGFTVPYLRSAGGGIFTAVTEFVGNAGNQVGLVRINNTQNGNGIHYPALQVINQYGNHSYGIIAEFRTSDTSTGDRPSILFSRGSGPNWAIGMGATSGNSDNFRIGYKGTYLLDTWATMRMDMDTSGNVTFSGTVTSNSDVRLKDNIEVITNALEKIQKVRGVTFTRKDEIDNNIGRKHAGVIAQEVLDVLPELVSQTDSGMYNVAYGNMAGLFIEAIKEQQKQIEELQNKINLLIQNK